MCFERAWLTGHQVETKNVHQDWDPAEHGKQRPCYEMHLPCLFMTCRQYFYLWGLCSVSKGIVVGFIFA